MRGISLIGIEAANALRKDYAAATGRMSYLKPVVRPEITHARALAKSQGSRMPFASREERSREEDLHAAMDALSERNLLMPGGRAKSAPSTAARRLEW